jgi:hypothetical protein
MSNLVFISGDFCSGSTLLFTLFRKTGEFYCLYEPLHEKHLEYLIWPPRVYEHHYHVDNYYAEYHGFQHIPELFQPAWGVSSLYLPPEAPADDMYRYLCYLTGTAFGRSPRVMLKENRISFRLGWIRANFPQAKIIHIYRDREKQWNSLLRRVQAWCGREDVGQNEVTFAGFNIAAWCEDLKHAFPDLDASRSRTGYERFCKLWESSLTENRKYADLSVDYASLLGDLETTCERLSACLGCRFDSDSLKEYVVPPAQQKPLRLTGLGRWRDVFLDRNGGRYARLKLKLQTLMQERVASARHAAGSGREERGG